MKFFLTGVFGLAFFFSLPAQQLPQGQNMQVDGWLWNPALTGHYNYLEAGGYYRRQWNEFRGAPRTAFLGVHIPFIETNMGLGLAIGSDEAGPLRQTNVSLAYAYRIRSLFTYGDQLSFGLSGHGLWYRFSGIGLVFNDPDDPAILAVRENFQSLQAGAGMLYSTIAGDNFEESGFFLGFSARQLLPAGLQANTYWKETIHFNALAGFRFANDNSFVEPSMRVHFTAPGQWYANFAVRYEYLSGFWAGGSFSSEGAMSIMGGLILGSNRTANTLHLGAQGSFGLASRINGLGSTLEFIAIYRYYGL